MWWSPDYSNALIMSDNAAPMYMFRISREAPFEIPGLSKVLGPMKVDIFMWESSPGISFRLVRFYMGKNLASNLYPVLRSDSPEQVKWPVSVARPPRKPFGLAIRL